MNKTYTYKGKTVGILEDGIFKKEVDPAKHFMRINQSWGLDLKTFQDLPHDTKIELHDKNKVYKTTWQTYADNGTVEDFGHGRQIFLSKDKFTL